MIDSIIPQSYEQWRHCIIKECGIDLTPDYIDQQLALLEDKADHYTQQFVRLYGPKHLENVLTWFAQAKSK